jgi:hypothetical protein
VPQGPIGVQQKYAIGFPADLAIETSNYEGGYPSLNEGPEPDIGASPNSRQLSGEGCSEVKGEIIAGASSSSGHLSRFPKTL